MRRRIFTAATLGVAAFLAGCAAPQPMSAKFDPAEHAAFSKSGTGVIEGQAFLKTKGGDVKLAAGNVVSVFPATSYWREWRDRSVIGGVELSGGDDRANQFVRETQADGEGRFRFDGLPAGSYILTCEIRWHYSEYGQTGGIAHARVTVRDGEVTRAVVTR